MTFRRAGAVAFLLAHFFFVDSPPTTIYTLSLHDALPICAWLTAAIVAAVTVANGVDALGDRLRAGVRSEEHTSELQSRLHLVCRLLLEKKKNKNLARDRRVK